MLALLALQPPVIALDAELEGVDGGHGAHRFGSSGLSGNEYCDVGPRGDGVIVVAVGVGVGAERGHFVVGGRGL